jgi:hypothetical protein
MKYPALLINKLKILCFREGRGAHGSHWYMPRSIDSGWCIEDGYFVELWI